MSAMSSVVGICISLPRNGSYRAVGSRKRSSRKPPIADGPFRPPTFALASMAAERRKAPTGNQHDMRRISIRENALNGRAS